MQRLIIGCSWVAAASLAFGQGTVQFSNTPLERISSGGLGAAPSTWVVVPASPAGLINYGLFYGIGESTSLAFLSSTLGVNSTSTTGLIVSLADNKSAITALPIPGTIPGQTDVWVQVKGWTGSFGTDWQAAQTLAGAGVGWFGETSVINALALGPTTGPGAVIWQPATGTDPQKFRGGFELTTMPEPGTFELTGLGAAALMLLHRRR